MVAAVGVLLLVCAFSTLTVRFPSPPATSAAAAVAAAPRVGMPSAMGIGVQVLNIIAAISAVLGATAIAWVQHRPVLLAPWAALP